MNDTRTHTAIRAAKTPARPTSVRFGRWRRYRWDAETFRLDVGNNGGVYDHYVHLGGNWGWAFTRWGALFAAARVVNRKAKR